MREDGEDGFPSIFPQRVGNTDVGVAQERSMHASAGGYRGIRTVEYANNDGTVTTLRTRLGWPVFETTEVSGGPVDRADIKGLVTNGVLEDNDVAFDGRDMVKASPVFPGGNVVGEAYQVKNFTLNGALHKNALVSGENHWFAGENLGSLSWVYVPEVDGPCWKVTLTDAQDDLSSFTLTFESMPTTGYPSPSRTVEQTETVSDVSPIDGTDEAFPDNAAFAIEDIAPNGGRIIVVNKINVQTMEDALHSHSGNLVCGRAVYAACELTITGIPPAASVSLETLYNNIQARGTYSKVATENGTPPPLKTNTWPIPGTYITEIEINTQWLDVLVGLRYEFSGSLVYVSPVLMDLKRRKYSLVTDVLRAGEPYFLEEDPVTHDQRWRFDDPGDLRDISFEDRYECLMEGAKVTIFIGPCVTIDSGRRPAYWRDGVCHAGDDPKLLPYNAPFYTDSGDVGSSTPNTLQFGSGEFPATSGGAGVAFSSPLVSSLHGPGFTQADNNIEVYRILDSTSNKYLSRPMWGTRGFRARTTNPNYTSDDITTGTTGSTTGGGGAILPVKYANRVFGLQANIYSPVLGGNIARGIGIAFPACIGKADPNLPNKFYSTVAASRLGAKLNNQTSSIEYRGWRIFQPKLPVTGTARYLQPKAVLDLKNVVYAHYF